MCKLSLQIKCAVFLHMLGMYALFPSPSSSRPVLIPSVSLSCSLSLCVCLELCCKQEASGNNAVQRERWGGKSKGGMKGRREK